MSRCTRAYQTWGPAVYNSAVPRALCGHPRTVEKPRQGWSPGTQSVTTSDPQNTNKASRYPEKYAGRRRPKSSPAIPSWEAWGNNKKKKLASHTAKCRVSTYKSSLLVPRSVIPLLARWYPRPGWAGNEETGLATRKTVFTRLPSSPRMCPLRRHVQTDGKAVWSPQPNGNSAIWLQQITSRHGWAGKLGRPAVGRLSPLRAAEAGARHPGPFSDGAQDTSWHVYQVGHTSA